MVLNNFVKAACLSACLGLASGSILANVETNGGLHVYDSSDSDHWFNLNGKMRLDQTMMHAGQAIEGSLKLRSLEATMAGGVGENLSYSFRLKNSGDAASIDKAQVTYSGFNSWSKVTVGQVGMPYGLGSTLSEDSMATQVFGPESPKGAVGISVTAWNDKMGLMASFSQSNQKLSLTKFNTSARLSFAPLMRDNLILHVGANAYMQKQELQTLNYSLANGQDNLVNLDGISSDNRGFGLDAAVLRGPLFVQAEVHQVQDTKSSAYGYNVEASYALTGETREYNKVKGAFSQLNSSNEGASWQVSARHSGVHAGKKVHRTVGANLSWIANNNLTVLANYENMLTAEKNPGALTLRLQAAW